MGLVYKAFRVIFFHLDKVVFGLIDDIYGLLLQLARTSIFDQDIISQFSQRVYAIVGIFMLFKVSVSLINYILNPDDFTDKEKGFTSIIKRIVLSLAMIVLVPYIFNEAYELQSIILEENSIMTMVFGSPAQRTEIAGITLPNKTYADMAGQKIQFTVLFAFTQPNYQEFSGDSYFDLSGCREPYAKYVSADRCPKGGTYCIGQFKFRKKAKTTVNPDNEETSSFIYELNPSCFGYYNPDTDLYEAKPADGGNEAGNEAQLLHGFSNNPPGAEAPTAFQNYAQGVAQQSFDLMFKENIILAKEQPTGNNGEGRYLINYKFPVSTVVGCAVVYILFLFCIDIALRSVKLGFLEMIAPIPILSYVDPKSGKEGMFKKWFQMCTKTYAELFFRLFALYFGIYVISLIGTFRDVITGEIVDNWVVRVFLIIGILMFVKKLPEILKEVLDIKTNGKFELNPMKKLEDEMWGGKRITGAAAGVAGGTIGALTGAGVLRGITGGVQGFMGNKGFGDTLKNTGDMNAKYRKANLVDHNPIRRTIGRIQAGISDAAGAGGELARIERQKQQLKDSIDREKRAKERIEGEIAPQKQTIADHKRFADSVKAMEQRAKDEIAQGNGGSIGLEYLRRKNQVEYLKQHGGTAAQIAAAEQSAQKYLNDTGMKQYMEEASTHTGNFAGNSADRTFDNLRATAEQAGQTVHVTLDTRGGEIHKQFGEAKGTIGELERGIYDREQEIATHDTTIKQASEQMQQITEREERVKSYRVK